MLGAFKLFCHFKSSMAVERKGSRTEHNDTVKINIPKQWTYPKTAREVESFLKYIYGFVAFWFDLSGLHFL